MQKELEEIKEEYQARACEEEDLINEFGTWDVFRILDKAFQAGIDSERKRILEGFPEENKPKLGSENQDEYVAYANGYNDGLKDARKVVEGGNENNVVITGEGNLSLANPSPTAKLHIKNSKSIIEKE